MNGELAVASRAVESWQRAEEAARDVLASLGIEAELTQPGADGGLDLVGEDLAGQVKWKADPVRRPAVQGLKGAALGRCAVFFSRTGYTDEAVGWANEAGVALFILREDWSVLCINPAAEELAGGALPTSDEWRRSPGNWVPAPTRPLGPNRKRNESTMEDRVESASSSESHRRYPTVAKSMYPGERPENKNDPRWYGRLFYPRSK